MKTIAYFLAGALALGTGMAVSTAPASADEPVGFSHRIYKGRPVFRYRAVSSRRRFVRKVVVERPVYRTRRIVREIVVERPVVYRTRPLVREVLRRSVR